MDIEYTEAKNGLKTFKINSIFYHSSYDPEKEAHRFSDTITLPYTPTILFVIEPGFNYCEKFLQDRFPNTKLISIRLIEDFYSKENSIPYNDFTNYCFNNFTSEELLNSFIINWPSAEKLFESEILSIWSDYKKHLEIRKTELVSRQYFEKKWLLNSIHFFKNIQNITLLKQIDFPVLIAASGPSLKDNLQFIKENQSKLIIIGLSSAINVLLRNQIIPDFCISTDGGFWAKKHLYPLKDKKIPLAISSESGIPKEYFNNISIIPLCYVDDISSEIFSHLNFPYIKAERNPTVSGTALILAKQLTSSSVYFAGLDLCCQKGFAHCQPNILEVENSLKDNRLKPASTRTVYSEYSTGSLDIFRDNFSLLNNVSNCFRIVNENINNKLGNIKDISVSDFQNSVNKYCDCNKSSIFQNNIVISEKDKKEYINNLIQFFKINCNKDIFKKNLFPIDFLSISHAEENNKEKLNHQLNEKIEKIMNKIWRILDEQ